MLYFCFYTWYLHCTSSFNFFFFVAWEMFSLSYMGKKKQQQKNSRNFCFIIVDILHCCTLLKTIIQTHLPKASKNDQQCVFKKRSHYTRYWLYIFFHFRKFWQLCYVIDNWLLISIALKGEWLIGVVNWSILWKPWDQSSTYKEVILKAHK